jgi:molybdenum cofactor cytidylyltransferase
VPQSAERAGESHVMLYALIPAAGHSSRMGQPKLALPLGGQTVLERVIHSLRKAGAHTLVVLGPHVADLANSAKQAGAEVLQLKAPTEAMRATVEAGLSHLSERFHPADDEIWLLIPADHPTLDDALIRRLHAELQARPDCSIAVPVYANKRGHPALIRWRHLPGIRAFPHDLGLNAYFRQFPIETLEVAVDSPDVLLDLDTPEDYERLRKRFE